MISLLIGNDLVDLKLPANQASAANDRFLQRVLSADEYDIVTASANPARLLWMHWAAKESAYKAWRRTAADLAFIQRNFHVTIAVLATADERARGTVRHADKTVDVEWTWCADWVHCTVVQASSDRLYAVETVESVLADPLVDQIADAHRLLPESIAVRVLAGRLLTRMSVDDARVVRDRRSQKNAGVPRVLFADGSEADVLLSMSHDGRFVAASLARATLRSSL